MALEICSDHLAAIFDHAERIYPEECCGLLLGHFLHSSDAHDSHPSSPTKRLIEVWETHNAWDADAEHALELLSSDVARQSLTKSRRYWIDPRDMLAAQKYARDRQLDIIGVYHSHPDHPAEPSECDRVAAWPQYSYLIISVQQGRAKHLRSWTLDDQDQFQGEDIHAIATVEPDAAANVPSNVATSG